MERETLNELQEQIVKNLAAPEEIQTDAGRVKNKSVGQSVEALKYLGQLSAVHENQHGQIGRVGFFKVRNRD